MKIVMHTNTHTHIHNEIILQP